MQATFFIIPTAFVLAITILWLIATELPRLERLRAQAERTGGAGGFCRPAGRYARSVAVRANF